MTQLTTVQKESLLIKIRDYLVECHTISRDYQTITPIRQYQEKGMVYYQIGGDSRTTQEPYRPEIELVKKDFAQWWEDNKKQATFKDLVFQFMWKRELEPVDLYKAMNMDRRQFSKVMGKNTNPSRQVALSFCLGLRLNWQEAEELMASAGYSFATGNIADGIVQYCIAHKLYDISIVEDLLQEFHQPTLHRVTDFSGLY